MKQIKRFLLAVLCAAPFGGVNAAPVATTAGSNLTAYNPNVSLTGNQWVTAMNPRNLNSGQKVEADFGNCNALILRCAQPKCSGTGCADTNVATSIVTGCIQANDTCKQYADQGLTEYIVGQLVASSSAKANDAAIALETAKAQAAAQQNSQQLQDMQIKMQQMQNEMANQNAATIAELKNALEEQKALNAVAQQPAQPVQDNSGSGLSAAQQVAAANNVSADILVREQVSGEILTSIENAEVQLKTLKATMYQPGGTSIFTYAGCDSTGSNCTGPKRVRRFKELANGFFDPYNSVLDEMYDALITAQNVGVDVTDIYMMLNDSCNQWGQYLCSQRAKCRVSKDITDFKDSVAVYDYHRTCTAPNSSDENEVYSYYDELNCVNGTSKKDGPAKGGHECTVGMVIPPEDDMYCTLQKTLSEKDGDIQRQWLYADQGDLGDNVRVGCASSALDSVALFRNRKKKSNLDIETLQRMINQDAQTNCWKDGGNCVKWCKIGDSKNKLIGYTTSKSLDTQICLKAEPSDSNNSGVACQDGDGVTPYVIPELALCSVHAYNIGETDNNLISTNRSEMNDVIALKATVITQQMYKQYEYLESMIKRFKTQLKKAVLTAKVQMVNGDSGSSGSTGSSSGYSSNIDRRNDIYLADAKNCREEIGVEAIINCLTSNYNEMNSKYKDSSISSDLKKQMKSDQEILENVFKMIIVPTDYAPSCQYDKDSKCLTTSMSSSDIKKCLSNLSTNLTKAKNCYDLSQRQYQTK